jgi:hypothetical protein
MLCDESYLELSRIVRRDLDIVTRFYLKNLIALKLGHWGQNFKLIRLRMEECKLVVIEELDERELFFLNNPVENFLVHLL